jgi:hypothetical protein
MRRLGRRTILIFGIYFAVLLAAVIAGFIGQAVGIWAAVLWGAAFIGGLILYGRRLRPRRVDGTGRPPEGSRYLPTKPAKLRGTGKSAAEYVSEGRR